MKPRKKRSLSKELLEETMPDGKKKMALSRIFLLIFLLIFIGVIGLLIVKSLRIPLDVDADSFSKIFSSQLEAIKTALQALEWIIGFFLIYVLGTKGMSWYKPPIPINNNYPDEEGYDNAYDYYDMDGTTNIVVQNQKPVGDGTLINPSNIPD